MENEAEAGAVAERGRKWSVGGISLLSAHVQRLCVWPMGVGSLGGASAECSLLSQVF